MLATVRRRWTQLHITLKALAVAVGVAALALVVWLAGPLFYNTRVDEAFPVAASTSVPATAPPTAAAPAALPTTAATPEVLPTPPSVAEAPPVPAAVTAPEVVASPAPTATPVGPLALVQGAFVEVGSRYTGEGQATVYRNADGTLLLRLEDFAVTNGPDLFVALSGHPLPSTSGEVHGDGYLEVARLKANEGSQNYALPAGIDLSRYRSVVIYCRAFSVVFSSAELVEVAEG